MAHLLGVENLRLTVGSRLLLDDVTLGIEDGTQGVVVLRLAGLPTVPVDLVMRLWGAAAEDIAPNLDHLVELARQVAPVV